MPSRTPVSSGTVSARIALTLDRLAADVFGVMGNGNAWFLDAVVTSTSLRYTAVRHEAAAVAAADAYYRASGRSAVATTTYGPGYTNAITPLTEAVQARIPLVLVTGAGPRDPRAHDIDQGTLAMAAGAAYFAHGHDDAGCVTEDAVSFAIAGRTAVVLAIPYDLADAPDRQPDGERPTRPLGFTGAPAPESDSAIAAAAGILAAAQRPLVLAGRGAWLANAQDAAAELADRLGALTTTSALAMGFFEGESDLGISGGFASEVTAGLIEQADVVLVLGAGLNPFTTRFGDAFADGAHVIQVDVSGSKTNPRVNTFLRGDAADVARALIAALPPVGAAAWDRDALDGTTARPGGDTVAPDGRLDPRSLMRRIDALLPDDRIIVQDGGHFIGWAPTYLRVPAPDRLLMVGTAFQTIGLGLPSAVGAGRARPGSTIVLCSGDGGALMGLADLETVIREVRHGVVLIFNDAAYGAEVHQYGVRGVDERPMLIPEVDFAGVARALGAESAVIRDLDDLGALEQWLASGAEGVFLADMHVSREVVAPYMHEVVAAAKRPHP
jgi:thiamine pyrophosphate-dependent acetolactate synthase large subunit-like protein